ncbi:TEL2, telomere maintenance protein 2 [Phlyctochytrium planicorne]|nr:TEL2, telomere maintenance protein 2 [Phlyctochytrium planicorne]
MDIFGIDEIKNNTVLQHVLAVDLIVKRTAPVWALKDLADLSLSFEPPHQLSLKEILKRLMGIWSSAYFVSNSDIDRFKCRDLHILNLPKAHGNEAEMLKFDAMQGVQNYLQLDVALRRNYGLATAEILFNRASPVEPLNFDLETDADLKLLRSFSEPSGADAEHQPTGFEEEGLQNLPEHSKEPSDEDNFDPFEEEDPDMPAFTPQGDSDDDSDDSDADELKPLSSPEPITSVNSIKKPVYIRECVDLLKGDDPDSQESAMRNVSAILHMSEPRDIAENSVELFGRLFQVGESPHIEDFDSLRKTCLMEVCLHNPDVVSEHILKELPTQSYNITQRVEFLHVVAIVAMSLASPIKKENTSWNPVTLAYVERERRRAHGGEWRRKVFYGVLGVAVNSQTKPHLRDDIIFGQLLTTLAVLASASSNHPHQSRMCMDLIDFTLSILYRKHGVRIRSAIVVCLGVGVGGLNVDFGAGERLEFVARYLGEVEDWETDNETKEKIKRLINILGGGAARTIDSFTQAISSYPNAQPILLKENQAIYSISSPRRFVKLFKSPYFNVFEKEQQIFQALHNSGAVPAAVEFPSEDSETVRGLIIDDAGTSLNLIRDRRFNLRSIL